MPITTPVFKTGLSFSQNSSLRTNLRGILVGGTTPFDYAMQPYDAIYWRSFDPVNNVVVTNTSDGNPAWANKIRNTYAKGGGGGDPLIRYVQPYGRFSSVQSGTLLVRIYINSTSTSPSQTIVINGATAGYALQLTYTPPGKFTPASYNAYFLHSDISADRIQVSTTSPSLAANTWYHFGIKFITVEDPFNLGNYITSVTSYQDGVQTKNNEAFTGGYVGSPSGDCSLFSKALLGDPFDGKITDFSFFETQLTEDQIQTYAKVGVT
jgi:hypothetical protein